MNELDFLAHKYKTDKRTNLDGETQNHGYTETYYNLFSAKRYDFKNILELGIWFGSSHRMWKDYFPNADIYGVDNFYGPFKKMSDDNPDFTKERVVEMVNGLIKELSDFGIKIILGNQEDENVVSSAIGDLRFDVIIDDGGHHAKQQQKSFKYLWDFVAPGGYYIIEDLGVAEQREFREFDDMKSSTTAWLQSILDMNPFSYYISKETLEDMMEEIESIRIIGELAIIRKVSE